MQLPRSGLYVAALCSAVALSTEAHAEPERAPLSTAAIPSDPVLNDAKAPHLARVVSPPDITALLPAKYNKDEVSVRVGAPLIIVLKITQPSGHPLGVTALGLPEGAVFDESLRTLRWTPMPTQVGQHALRFVASDGDAETSRSLLISVGNNTPPRFLEQSLSLMAGSPQQLSFTASDADADPLHYSVTPMPEGAKLDAASGTLSWSPLPSQVGAHVLTVTATDGSAIATQTFDVQVLPATRTGSDSEWNSFLLPGVGYSLYSPRGADNVGFFHGLNLEILIAAWIHKNDNRGPSLGRVYTSVELLRRSEGTGPLLFTYAIGTTLSFERNPQRSFLIPFYGVDLGGVVHRVLGSRLQATAFLGAHLYADRNLFIGARVGYRVVPSKVDELAGLQAGLNLNFSVW